MKRLSLTATMALTTVLSAGISCAAMADAKSQIKHRMGVMEAIGGHFNATIATLGGPAEFQPNHQMHATSIATLAKIAPKLFPEGSGEGKTKAKAEIWEQADQFNASMDDFVVAADALAAASMNDDMGAYVGAIKGLGKTCKSCHDDFKKK
jgi:cytochrome c556